MASTDSRPVPQKNVAFRHYFAIRKNDGTLITTWAGMDSEVSKDGGSFADCTNEATEIGTSGCGYIDLTSTEMNADSVIYKLTVTNTGALPIVVTFFPEESGDYRANVTQWNGTAVATPATAGYPAVTLKSGTGTGELSLSSGLVTLAGVTHTGAVIPTVSTLTGHTAQTGDAYAIVNHTDYGNAKLVRSTTPANTLDVAATGEAGLDFNNIKAASGATTLTNITVPTVTTLTGHTAQTGDTYARLGAPVGASISADLQTVDDFLDTEIAAIKAKTDSLTFTVANKVDANLTHWLGTAAATPTVAGVPEVDVTHLAGNAVTGEATSDGTAQAGAASTITLASAASSTNSIYNDRTIRITGGTGIGQSRVITGYVGSTRVATVHASWTTNPDNTSTYSIGETSVSASVVGNLGGNVNGNVVGSVGSVTGAVGSVTGAVGSVTGNVGGNVVGSTASVSGAVGSVTGAVGSVAGNVDGKVLGGGGGTISGAGVRADSVTGAVGSVTGAVGSVTGNVGGNVTGSVGSLAAQAKTDVNAEVLDVLATDTFAEVSAVPAATSTLKDKINWMFAIATSSNGESGGTFTRGEWT
jgi:hypothetical protein